VSIYTFYFLTGLLPLIFYSNNLLTKLNEDRDFLLTPTVGTAVLSLAHLGSLFSPLLSKFFGTRPILYGGHFIAGACMIAIAILQSLEIDVGVFIFMFLFIFVIASSLSPKLLTYSSEVGGGMAMGVGNFVKDIVLIVLLLFT